MPDFTQDKIALLLMAAGSSSRLGQPKQLVEISVANKSSGSLLHRQVAMMDTICLSINAQAYCVLGFEGDTMIKHLANSASAQNLTIIDNANWSHGLSTSIAKGVSLVASDVSAVLVFLVDQWQLSTENLTQLITQWRKQPEFIHVASLDECFSPPVIFPRRFFNELIALTGDDGAKKVIKDNIKQVKSVAMPNAFVDLDTPEQLQNLKNNKH
ncbi:MAG: hypothetical protein COB83_04375 [Gammaproteobacteria bacterium]|nr:MAG: hypothetical protein COB83_04375 [Gammaproteobacteria bacterium]